MATKTITGAYPAGYYLDPAFETLIIAGTATVGGAGVTTATTQPTTVNNRDSVNAEQHGITLSDGGTINNGTSSDPTAQIYGYAAGVLVQNGAGDIRNWGKISSNSVAPSIILESGGKVSNLTADSEITNGILISGAVGTVVNRGKIGSVGLFQGGSVNNGANGATSAVIQSGIVIGGGSGEVVNNGSIAGPFSSSGDNYSSQSSTGPSISMYDGGTVTNGTGSNTSAVLSNGISISGGSGTVVNIGFIGGTSHDDSSFDPYGPGSSADSDEGPSVQLTAGGSITNGSVQHTGATLSQGVTIAGGTGSVVNFGSIGAAHSASYSFYISSEGTSYSVAMSAGGIVTNGTSESHTASISNGISISGGAGTVRNHGTIGGPSSSYHDAFGGSGHFVGFSVVLKGGGTVTNGSATNSAALLANGVSLQGAAGTVINFGVIGSNNTDGVAVGFDNADDVLIEHATGVLDGSVAGGGGTLVLAADAVQGTIGGIGSTITGFSTVRVDADATWNLDGDNTIVAGSLFANKGTIGATGLLTNHGTLSNSGVIGLGTTGQIDNQSDGKLDLMGDVGVVSAAGAAGIGLVNAGLLRKSSGTGTSIIRTSVDDTGKIVVASGKLELAGKTTSIAGSISGAGTVWFGPGAATLEAGTKITTGGLQIGGSGAHVTVTASLSYAGTFSQTAASELTVNDGDILTLSGTASFSGNTVDGAGRLSTKGATTLSKVTLGGTAEWLNAGTIDAVGKLTVGDAFGNAATIFNQAGGVFDIVGDNGIAIGSAATSRFINDGVLEKTGGTGRSIVATEVVNSGTIVVTSGTLDLENAVTGTGGTFTIHKDSTLEVGSVAAHQVVAFSGSNAELVLDAAASFKATLLGFDTNDELDLKHFGAATTISYAGNASGGTLTVTDGAEVAKIALLGQYAAAGFHTASDGHGGTLITYAPAAAAASLADHLAGPQA